MSSSETARLSSEFRRIHELASASPLSLGAILVHLEHRGHALFTLFLAGPFLLPLPLPGLSVPFGLLIVLFAVALGWNSRPLLPKAWLRREIPQKTLLRFSLIASRFFARFERLFKPRLTGLIEFRAGRFLIALMIAICGLLLALPLPPGTNAPPAVAIACLSIGFLERDGIIIALGYILFFLNIVFFALLGIYGMKGVNMLLAHLAGMGS